MKDFVIANVDPQNIGSVRVLQKCGFEFWKEMVERVWQGKEGAGLVAHRYRIWGPGKGPARD